MRRFWIVLFVTLLGYAAGALVGALTILAMSAQISDPIAEAILAGFIGVGPVAAAIAAVGALWATKRAPSPRKS